MPTLASYNRLSDIVASLQVSPNGDTGTVASFGGVTATTLNFDTITITDNEDTVDGSGGQDRTPVTRTTKEGFTAEIECKWGPNAKPIRGKQAKLTIVGGGAEVVTGRITSVTGAYSNDSTLRITISPYGTPLA